MFDFAVERLLLKKTEKKIKLLNSRILGFFVGLTARIGGSKLRSMGFMMMKTCWFL